MTPWHLVWIIPACVTFGYGLAILLVANRLRGDRNADS